MVLKQKFALREMIVDEVFQECSLNHRKTQARIYVTGTSRWWDQHFAVWGFNWESLRNGNNPWHHFAMTTSSSYRWYSWTWSSQGQEYWYWCFLGGMSTKLNMITEHTVTRYNTQEVTPRIYIYAQKNVYWLLAAAEYVWIWLKHWFSDEKYNVADWFRFFEYVEEKTIRRLYDNVYRLFFHL